VSLLPSDIPTGEIISSIMLMGVALIGVRLVSYGIRVAREMIEASDSGLSWNEYRKLDYEDRKYFRR